MPLKKYFYWSLGFHGGILLLLIVLPSFSPFGKWNRFHEDKVVWVQLPKGSSNEFGSPLKRSIGLPQTTIAEQKKALESPPSGEKKFSMTYKKQNLKKTPPKRPGQPDSRVDDALARIQRQVATKKAEPEAAQVPETRPGGFTIGTGTGPYVSPDDPEYVFYQAKIRKRIMDEWILPLKYADEGMGLICQIIVHINDQGEVVETEWEQRSNNPTFDLSALRAIERSSPLDVPPERLKYEVFNEGFIVEFKPTTTENVAP